MNKNLFNLLVLMFLPIIMFIGIFVCLWEENKIIKKSNIIFEKWAKKDGYFIIIYWISKFHLSICWYSYMQCLEISLGAINIIIGFPLKNE